VSRPVLHWATLGGTLGAVRELIALDLPAGPAFLHALTSAWEQGDAVLPLDPKAPRAYTEAVLRAMAPAAVIDATAERHALPGSLPVEQDDALVVMTSGTTGTPKGAVHTHAAVEYAAFCSSTAAGVIPDSCWLACLPLSHVGGLSVVTRAILTGTGLKMLDRAEPSAISQAQIEGATHVSLVPTLLGRIDPEPFHTILLGGSAIPHDRPKNCIATYGLTETFGGVVYDGLALNGVEVRISNAGLIELRSPTLLRGYRDRSDPLDAQGWLRTGDIGRIDPHTGVLSVEGRSDEMILTGGEKVWPQSVEAVLVLHEGVSEVAVIGVADPEWGQRVIALVVPTQGLLPPTLQQARELVREQLPVAAAPKEIRLVDSLPRTSVGKIRRMQLMEQHSPEERSTNG
jgi:O-succinylbenzoic acid--CoA ligase